MTNLEYIKQMGAFELAEFLCDLMGADECKTTCPAKDFCSIGNNGMHKWLASEHKEEADK